MKYLQMLQILKTNKILQSIEDKHPSLTIDFEVFSCKSSKKQKLYLKYNKPLRYLLETLQLAFPDYNFTKETESDFLKVSYQEIANELIYAFIVFHKNKEDVVKFVEFLGVIIDKTVHLDDCQIYKYINRNGPFEKCVWFFSFLFYSKKDKRVLMLNFKC
ncbi:repressor of rna polymerase iii transcription maf1-like protein [Vairimorpha apis BRL 01]|uniref:Repressor of rna polymerase iii transcription maf1-like protein n=1 Tax=Vairimorpha apis BRL 01 TaxID=1037528 RepID=T0MA58_9MICR|nr:repressor of rna polymerase iii transcription maf1-like protein [Vairimorpha apis BRL 01]